MSATAGSTMTRTCNASFSLLPVHSRAMRKLNNPAVKNIRTCPRRSLQIEAYGAGGGRGSSSSSGGDMSSIHRLLGQALQEDRKKGFGPPPPKDREGGSGFVNLVGREDLLAGEREFNVARAEARERSSSSSSGNTTDTESSSGETTESTTESRGSTAEGDSDSELPANIEVSQKDSSPVEAFEAQLQGEAGGSFSTDKVQEVVQATREQKVIAAGTLALTFVALARRSEELVPQSALEFLQAWMAFAWVAHFGLACVAAWLAQQQQRPSSAWFLKVLFCGATAFEKQLWQPALEDFWGKQKS